MEEDIDLILTASVVDGYVRVLATVERDGVEVQTKVLRVYPDINSVRLTTGYFIDKE